MSYIIQHNIQTDLARLLPEYETDENNITDVATYRGGIYHSLIKQVDFSDSLGNIYSVSIVTSVKQSIPQIRQMLWQLVFIIIIILVITSLVLNLWIYSSIIKPVNKLKLATDNIKEGNFDFEMPRVPDNEIGDVCKDFEEMRLILKKSSEDKLQSDKEEKIEKMDVETAKKYMQENQFGASTMLPKVEAAVSFVEKKAGRKAVITSIDRAKDGFLGKTGTVIE